MAQHEWLAERFEADGPRLRAVAYRMLGSPGARRTTPFRRPGSGRAAPARRQLADLQIRACKSGQAVVYQRCKRRVHRLKVSRRAGSCAKGFEP